MSIDVMTAVWRNGPENSTERFVLVCLADRANDKGYCYPSYADIAKRCALSRPTVIKAMNRLQESGWIRTEVQYKSNGSRNANGIYLNLEMLEVQPRGSKETLPGSKETLPGVVKNLDGGSKDSLPKSSINHQSETSIDYAPPEPSPHPAPLDVLREHFVKRTAIQPNDRTGVYDRDWQQPLGQLLALAGGDVAAAVALLDRALAVARGDNERRKTYTVSCPRSLLGIASNLAATQQTAAAVADDDTIWQRALHAVGRSDYSDDRLKAAIRAIGGSGRIAGANGHDTERLKRELVLAYQRS